LGGGEGAVKAANAVPGISVVVFPAGFEDSVIDVCSCCGAFSGAEAPDAFDLEAACNGS